VIKVEGRGYPDWWRGADYSDEAIAAFGYEQPLYFQLGQPQQDLA